jgi:hypothetical protein
MYGKSVAQNMVYSCALLRMVVNLRVPLTMRNLLQNCILKESAVLTS